MGSPAIFVGNNTHFLTQGVEIPSQNLAAATALPRVAGVLYYITDDDMIYYDDGATLIAIGSGAQGAQGSQGAAGSQGAQGDAGTAGAQGAQGDTGATGAQGSQGDAGAQGPQGDTGAQGSQGIAGIGGGIQWEFDDVGNSPPPSSGTFKTDNGSMPSVTEIYISKTDYNTNNVANYLLSLDDSTNATKGYLSFFNSNDSTTGVIFKITSVTDQTGYVEVAVTYVQEFGASFAAGVKSVFFSPAGDVGATGAQGSQGAQGTPTSMGTLDGQSRSSNGATITTGALFLQTANTSFAGLVGISAQSWAGVKTFTATPQLTGLVSGASPAAGYIGETLAFSRTSDFSQTTPTLNTWYDITSATLTLTAGNWLLIAEADMNITTNDSTTTRLSFAELAIREDTAIIYKGRGTPIAFGNGSIGSALDNFRTGYGRATLVFFVSLSSAPVNPYKLSIRAVNVTGSPTMSDVTAAATTDNPILFRALRVS